MFTCWFLGIVVLDEVGEGGFEFLFGSDGNYFVFFSVRMAGASFFLEV